MSAVVVIVGGLIGIVALGLAVVLYARGGRGYEPCVMRPPHWPGATD